MIGDYHSDVGCDVCSFYGHNFYNMDYENSYEPVGSNADKWQWDFDMGSKLKGGKRAHNHLF